MAHVRMVASRLCQRRIWELYAPKHRLRAKFASFSDSTTQDPASFESLSRTFTAIEQVKHSRLDSIRLLAHEFRRLLALPTAQELTSALYLTASQLAPPYEGLELRFGAKTFVKLLEQLEVQHEGDVDSTWKLEKFLSTYPDYGQATQALLANGHIAFPVEEKDKVLSIQAVHETLISIGKDKGAGGTMRKQQLALQLLQQCRCSEERIMLVRILAHQNLRIGMGEKSILCALALASSPYASSAECSGQNVASLTQDTHWPDSVIAAYAQHPNYRVLAKVLHASQHEKEPERRIQLLQNEAHPETGVPVLTMSAYPLSSVAAVLERIDNSKSRTATCEFKYDGARVQVHLSLLNKRRGECSVKRIFSRNMENITERFSSLLNVLEERVTLRNADVQGFSPVVSLIVEGEVVACDREKGTFRPFQMLQTKSTSEFCLFLFDLLAVNDANLLQKPLRERRTLLHNLLEERPGYVEVVQHIDISLASSAEASKSTDLIQEFLLKAVSSGCEGLMVKLLDDAESEYKAGKRSYSWMKLKQDYLTDDSKSATLGEKGTFLADTLDLVPIGAVYGKGRRTGVFGSFLMATYNSSSGKFEVSSNRRHVQVLLYVLTLVFAAIGKVGSGFSDENLMEVAGRLQSHVLASTDKVPEQYESCAIHSRHPDVWFSPEEVWEIKATQLTESPLYTCGAGIAADQGNDAPRKGLALRFPRFIRFRPDKRPWQATESSQVVKLFQQQQQQTPH
ncbi:hypothetical protein PsorP6_001157 [Peronosclerospora sorghi]|uniref:Uncharacterized protein n=1 Tax=Peronosclerospora sorghi TaxID=230839 RepID=A0ACC0WUY2_9STRA|nr:hypothetical protein PsorP6_001157 [Peronosclerospora sorghi]